MERQVEEMLRRFPNLDRMMCETLLILHAQGKLDKYMEPLQQAPPAAQRHVLVGSVTVENVATE